MVPLVEDITGRHRVVVEPTPRRLGHHQRMVGHHEFSGAGAANGMFHEAAPPMRAGRVDALAASVGECIQRGAAEQFGEPAGQVAALDVAVLRRHRPARDQTERDQPRRRKAAGRAGGRVLQVQQAQIILPPLAHHHAPAPLGRIGEKADKLAVDLALQMAGEGADPDGAPVAFGPQAGRRDIAERLAGAGSRFRQHQMRIAAVLARREGRRGGAGVVGLPWPLFGIGPKNRGQARPRLGLADRKGRRRGQRRRILPFRQTFPHLQRLGRGRRIWPAKCGGDEWRPAPAPHAHLRGEASGIAVDRQQLPGSEVAQQRPRHLRQRHGRVLQPAAERVQVQRQRQPAGCGRGRPGGHDEGKQFQQVKARQGFQSEAAKGGRRMHQNRRRQCAQPARDLLGGAGKEFTVLRQNRGPTVAGDHRGCVRQQDPHSRGNVHMAERLMLSV